MIEMADLKGACNGILAGTYPDIKIYGSDSTEGLERPCFYTEIVPYTFNYESRNYCRISASFKITYLESVPDEVDQLEKIAEIRKAFGMVAAVGDMKLRITEYSFEYTGQNNDMLQITVGFDWIQPMETTDDYELIESVSINRIVEGE